MCKCAEVWPLAYGGQDHCHGNANMLLANESAWEGKKQA